MAWPQQVKIGRLSEQPNRFRSDDQTSIFGDSSPEMHQEQIWDGEFGFWNALGVVGRGFWGGGQECGWVHQEVGMELLVTFIGAEATVVVPAQGTGKTSQMWFSVNASARFVTDPDGADEPSKAKVRPSTPVPPGAAEQPDHVEQLVQAGQCHSEAPYPNNLFKMQQSIAVRMSFCSSGAGLVTKIQKE
eukprot:4335875-Prymnesium_polylepis.1